MENYKKRIKHRIALTSIYAAVVLILLATGIIHAFGGIASHAIGYTTGFCVGIEFVALYLTCRYGAALRNEDKLKALYIAENDERQKHIRTQMGSTSSIIVLAGLALGSVAAAFFNQTVFFTLLGATLFASMVKVILKFYYSHKY